MSCRIGRMGMSRVIDEVFWALLSGIDDVYSFVCIMCLKSMSVMLDPCASGGLMKDVSSRRS